MTIKDGGNSHEVSQLRQLKLYLFLSASAVNVFFAVIIIANSLSIYFFFYNTPMVIQIDLLPPVWTTLLWTGSLYVLYTTKEIVVENPSSRRVSCTLNVALTGSSLLIFSVVLASIGFSTAPSTRHLLDQLSLWASSIGFIISFAGSFLALFMIMTQVKSQTKLFLVYFFSLFIPIEILALMHWVAYPFDAVGNLGFAWHGAFLELQLNYIVYPLIFWLFIALLFSWIWVPILKRLVEKARMQSWARLSVILLGSSGSGPVASQSTRNVSSEQENFTSRKFSAGHLLPTAVLLGSLILGVFVAYYPYISRRPGLIGADSLGYYYTLIALDGKDLLGAAQLANEINSARMLYHLMLFTLSKVGQLPASVVIEVMPVLTIVANAVAVFWCVKKAERSALLASMAAVFSVFSFTTTISMYAGTLANWFAVALGFVMFGLVFELLEKAASKLFLAVTVTLISLFLVHYWTGLFFLTVLASYLALTLWERRQYSARLAFAGVLVALIVLIIVFFSGLLPRLLVPYGISNVFADSVDPKQMIGLFWTRLSVLIDSWFLGTLANPVMIGLALIGAVVCFYSKTRLGRLLISWTIVGSLLSILVSPIGADMNQWLLWRTLYLIPFQIQAALGVCFVSSKLGGLRQNEKEIRLLGEGLSSLESHNGSARNQNFIIVLYLVTGFVLSALLGLSLPVLFSLVFLNCLILTLVVHLKIKATGYNPTLVFMFNLLIVLVLFNCTLRSLAPLAVHRFLP